MLANVGQVVPACWYFMHAQAMHTYMLQGGILCMDVGMHDYICLHVGMFCMYVDILCLHIVYCACMKACCICMLHVGTLCMHVGIYIVCTCWHIVPACWHIVPACWHGLSNECYIHVDMLEKLCMLNLTQVPPPP